MPHSTMALPDHTHITAIMSFPRCEKMAQCYCRALLFVPLALCLLVPRLTESLIKTETFTGLFCECKAECGSGTKRLNLLQEVIP